MALQSIAILDCGLEEITKLLTNQGIGYTGIGVGNSSTTVNASNQTHLLGGETCFKDGNASYFRLANNSFCAQWTTIFQYNDLPSNVYCEAAVSRNASNATNICLLRCTYDPITLSSGDQFSLTLQVIPKQL